MHDCLNDSTNYDFSAILPQKRARKKEEQNVVICFLD